jgi:hypothetical protein
MPRASYGSQLHRARAATACSRGDATRSRRLQKRRPKRIGIESRFSPITLKPHVPDIDEEEHGPAVRKLHAEASILREVRPGRVSSDEGALIPEAVLLVVTAAAGEKIQSGSVTHRRVELRIDIAASHLDSSLVNLRAEVRAAGPVHSSTQP